MVAIGFATLQSLFALAMLLSGGARLALAAALLLIVVLVAVRAGEVRPARPLEPAPTPLPQSYTPTPAPAPAPALGV